MPYLLLEEIIDLAEEYSRRVEEGKLLDIKVDDIMDIVRPIDMIKRG